MKKNPNDATFRNINALKRRVAKLEAAVKQLTAILHKIAKGLR